MVEHEFLASSLRSSYAAPGSHESEVSRTSTDHSYENSQFFDLVFDLSRNNSKNGEMSTHIIL